MDEKWIRSGRLDDVDELSNIIWLPISKYEQIAEDAPPIDRRWLAIAKTHFQQGIMALRRAIENNETF